MLLESDLECMPLGGWDDPVTTWTEPAWEGETCATDPFDDFEEDDFDDDFDDDFEEEWDEELPGDDDYQTEFTREDGGGDLDFDDD